MSIGSAAQPSLLFSRFDAENGFVFFEVLCRPCAREVFASIGLSKTAVSRLFAQSRIYIDEGDSILRTLPPQQELRPGCEVAVSVFRRNLLDPSGSLDHTLTVLYEDPFILAVHKPAPLLVHGDGTGAPTLTDEVGRYLDGSPFPSSAQALQRLDVDTTGVVLFSKLPEFQSCFDALLSEGRMTKRYLAVVEGKFPCDVTRIDAPLGRDRHDARRMRIAQKGGQEALTCVEVLSYDSQASKSLLLVTLGTGRRHQIRVHLASLGFPIVNDPLYGNGAGLQGSLMLHCAKEAFMHPVTGQSVTVSAGWPERFSVWFALRDI